MKSYLSDDPEWEALERKIADHITMTTVIVDAKKRVRLPDAKPGQVFVVETVAAGVMKLTEAVPEQEQAFPRGSLKKYFTGNAGRDRDRLEAQLVKGTVQGPE